jgi:hypothetical protein
MIVSFTGNLYLHPNGQKKSVLKSKNRSSIRQNHRNLYEWLHLTTQGSAEPVRLAAGLWKKSKTEIWCGQIKWCNSNVVLCTAVPNDPLVVTQFIETIELLRVQGSKSNIYAVGDYNLRASGWTVPRLKWWFRPRFKFWRKMWRRAKREKSSRANCISVSWVMATDQNSHGT